MIKFGVITQIDATKGLARVNFDADNIVSDWLPCVMRKTLTEKESFPLDEKEHVVCLMDEHCENGVILGSIYSEVSTPTLTTADLFGIVFANGDFFKYDRTQKKLYVNVGTEIIFNGGTNGGLVNILNLISQYNANIAAIKAACVAGFTAVDTALNALVPTTGVSTAAFNTAAASILNLNQTPLEDIKIKH